MNGSVRSISSRLRTVITAPQVGRGDVNSSVAVYLHHAGCEVACGVNGSVRSISSRLRKVIAAPQVRGVGRVRSGLPLQFKPTRSAACSLSKAVSNGRALVCFSLSLSVRPSFCPSACLSVCLSLCLSVSLGLSLSVCLCVCVSVCLILCLSRLSICLYLSVCLFVCLSVCVCVCLSVRRSVLCLSGLFLIGWEALELWFVSNFG